MSEANQTNVGCPGSAVGQKAPRIGTINQTYESMEPLLPVKNQARLSIKPAQPLLQWYNLRATMRLRQPSRSSTLLKSVDDLIRREAVDPHSRLCSLA